MPFMSGGKRDYKRENALYNSSEEQKKKRAKRNTARRRYEKEHGDVPRNVDIDHKKPLSKGGSNAMSNLRATSQKSNRSFARKKNGGMK
jgi:5-methylcytosine-specific restriction endonuclease McrA